MSKRNKNREQEELKQEQARIKSIKHKLLDSYIGEEDVEALNLFEHNGSEFYRDCEEIGKGIDSGFKGLNEKLGGGLPAGFCIIGGGSGVGKTALAQQLALNMAINGQDKGGYTGQEHNNRLIIFVSLEMGLASLTARFLSHIYANYIDIPPAPYNKLSVKSILSLEYQGIDENPEINFNITAKITESKRILKQYGNRLILINSPFGVKVEHIQALYEHYKLEAIKQGQQPPVLIIDYLQAIAPSNDNATDKQNIDHTIRTLKILQDRNNALVIALSSLNRASYNEPISKSSFKESGSIEYTADTLIGLELYTDRESLRQQKDILNLSADELFNARTRYIMESPNPRPIALRILKNRLGTEASLYYSFCGKSMTFKETTKEEAKTMAQGYDFSKSKEPFKTPAKNKATPEKTKTPATIRGMKATINAR